MNRAPGGPLLAASGLRSVDVRAHRGAAVLRSDRPRARGRRRERRADDVAGRQRRRHDAAARARTAEGPRAGTGADRDGRRHRAKRSAFARRLHEPASRQRPCERDPGQPASARRQLPRLHGVAAARHAAGTVGLRRRHPHQPAVRRHRQLGPAAANGDRLDGADAGLQSAVRAQHARRRARGPDQGRLHAARHVAPAHGRRLRPRHGRRTRAAATMADGFAWYGAANVLRENGWRDDSASEVGQVFGKLGWRSAATRVSLTAMAASTDLHGNGLQEKRAARSATTRASTRGPTRRATARASSASRRATISMSAGRCRAHAYLRRIDTNTLNGDLNNDALGQPLVGIVKNDPFASAKRQPGAARRRHRSRNCNALLHRQPERAIAGRHGRTGHRQRSDRRDDAPAGRRRRIRREPKPLHADGRAGVLASRPERADGRRVGRQRQRRRPRKRPSDSTRGREPPACSVPTAWRSAAPGT